MASQIDLKSLYGGQIASADVVLKGMAGVEQELSRRHNERESQRAAVRQSLQQIRKPLLDVVGNDPGASQGMQELRSYLQTLRRKTLTPPVVTKESQRVFTRPFGALVVPPYDYQWTWDASSGNPEVSTSADENAGQMSFAVEDNSDPCSASAAVAVGIYFRPPTNNGYLQIWSNPSFSYSWRTRCWMAEAYSDGWIGLYVGCYDLAGGFAGAPVNQRISLWRDDSFWLGTGDTGENTSYPLYVNLPVDRDYFYAIWVWCGGSIGAQGDFWPTYSYAWAGLEVLVPSFTWELTS